MQLKLFEFISISYGISESKYFRTHIGASIRPTHLGHTPLFARDKVLKLPAMVLPNIS